MPTPENAIPMATPRRRTNQFGRKNAWPVYPAAMLPAPTSERREREPHRDREDSDRYHAPGSPAIHQAPEERRERHRYDEPERERGRRHAALPAELVEDRWEEQREGGAGVDADGHGGER